MEIPQKKLEWKTFTRSLDYMLRERFGEEGL